METINTIEASGLDPEKVQILKEHEGEIMKELNRLIQQQPDDETVQAVDRLGGIGNFGLSLSAIIEFAEGNTNSINPQNASFDVAFLSDHLIRQFITDTCKGRISPMDLHIIQDALIERL